MLYRSPSQQAHPTIFARDGEESSRFSLLRRAGHAHLIGIGGAGMRSLATVLAGWGWRLSGSDQSADSLAAITENLAIVHHGHARHHVPPDCDLVIHSAAIGPDNPERRRAADLGVPIRSYAAVLGEIMAPRCGLAVAGTHGKSTTTAMAAALLETAGLDPTVVCGAVPLGQSTGGSAGQGDHVLVEACEYRENFLHLRPQLAVITGIEADHFDYYDSIEQIEDAYHRFAAQLPPHGLLLVQGDCRAADRATDAIACRRETFGLRREDDWQATDLRDNKGIYQFGIAHHGRPLTKITLKVAGRHNVQNALAAAALAHQAGTSIAAISAGLSGFKGIRRRLETIGTFGGITLLDDFAHHPTEIAATLRTVREMFPRRRIWSVFQPHQASRTSRLLDEFAASLQNADRVVIADIFRAREGEPASGEPTAATLAERVRRCGAYVVPARAIAEVADVVFREAVPGDVVVLMGAGDIWKVRDELVQRFRIVRAVA